MKAYQFLLTLDEVEPLVWRRFVIPTETSFKRLHDTIQFVMGWQDAHLYEFDIEREQDRLEIVEDEEMYEQHLHEQRKMKLKPQSNTDTEFEKRYRQRLMHREMRKARTTKLPKYVETYNQFVYRYDYGDDWNHQLQLEKVLLDYEVGHPILLDGAGACPPEDVGGARGYQDFLEACNDPEHPEHEEIKRWGKETYVPVFDIDFINRLMEDLLRLKKIKAE